VKLPAPSALAGPTLVLGAAVIASFWGLELRDLSSTELEEFSGSGWGGILRRSITPTENDWGAHMPLSHLVRVGVVDLLGEARPLAWRLHVAVASCLAALMAHHLVARDGRPKLALGAGLLVALHPVVSFHAHESTNYGFGPFLGALLLYAVLRWEEDRARSSLLLAAAVVLGMSNDLFFLFPALIACAWTGWRAWREPTSRRRFATAWGSVALIGAGPALWFLRHALLLRSENIIGPHADPIPTESAAMMPAAWDLLRRFAGGYVGGYLDAGHHDPWLTHGPVVLVLLVGVVFLRRPGLPRLGVTAGWLALGSFTLVLLARLIFGAVTGREFTTEPRIYTALTVPLCISWTLLCSQMGPKFGAGALGLLVTLVAVPTGRQLATISDRDTQAADRITRLLRPGDGLMVTRQVRWRLPEVLQRRAGGTCIEDTSVPLPDRVWMALEEDGEQLQAIRGCDGQTLARPGDGWRVRLHQRFSPPDYDRKSASFLPELVLVALERGEPLAGEQSIDITVQSTLLSGSGDLVLVADIFPGDGERPDMRSEPRSSRAPLMKNGDRLAATASGLREGDWTRLSVRRSDAPQNSLGGLLRALDQPLIDRDAVPILAQPIEPTTLELPPLSGPALRVLERLLRSLLALGLLLGLSLRWRRARS